MHLHSYDEASYFVAPDEYGQMAPPTVDAHFESTYEIMRRHQIVLGVISNSASSEEAWLQKDEDKRFLRGFGAKLPKIVGRRCEITRDQGRPKPLIKSDRPLFSKADIRLKLGVRETDTRSQSGHDQIRLELVREAIRFSNPIITRRVSLCLNCSTSLFCWQPPFRQPQGVRDVCQ